MWLIRLLLALALIGPAPSWAVPAFQQQSGLSVGSSPVLGTCVSGYVLYNNNGVLGCQSAGAASLAIGGSITGSCTNGWILYYNGGVLGCQAGGGGSVSLSAAQTWLAAQTFTNSDILLLGSSTGATTFSSANAGATNYTLTFPAATDTLATLGQTQTFSGALTHSGANSFTSTTAFTGAALASAGTTTTILGGTTCPTFSNAGFMALGGYPSSACSIGTSGGGGAYLTSTYGLVLQGYGSGEDVSLLNKAGSLVAGIMSNTTTFKTFGLLNTGGAVQATGTVPTTTTGSCTTIGAATGGMMAGVFATTAACSTTTTIILSGLTAASHGYVCDFHDETTPTALINQTSYGTTSATATVSGVATGTTDTILYKCMGF